MKLSGKGAGEIERRCSLWEKYKIGPFFLKLPASSTPPFRIWVFSFLLFPPPLNSVNCFSIRLPLRISAKLEKSSPLQLSLSCFPKVLTRGLWIGRYLLQIGWGYHSRTFGDVLSPLFTISNKICQGGQIFIAPEGGAREDIR